MVFSSTALHRNTGATPERPGKHDITGLPHGRCRGTGAPPRGDVVPAVDGGAP